MARKPYNFTHIPAEDLGDHIVPSGVSLAMSVLGHWRVFLKAVPRADRPGWAAFAWWALGPKGEKIDVHSGLVAGPEARATVVGAAAIVRLLPSGTPFHYISDFQPFWGAFALGWLDNKWRADGFRNHPSKDRDLWAHLSELLIARRLAPTAGPPTDSASRTQIGILKALARLVQKPAPEMPRLLER
jgi:hypothetical protein